MVQALVTPGSGDTRLPLEAPRHHRGYSQLYSQLFLHHQQTEVVSPHMTPTLSPASVGDLKELLGLLEHLHWQPNWA